MKICLSQLAPNTHIRMFISLERKVREKLKMEKREFYLCVLLVILENVVHLFICGMGDAGKVLLLTRRFPIMITT